MNTKLLGSIVSPARLLRVVATALAGAIALTGQAEQPTADLASMDLQQLLQVSIGDPVRPRQAEGADLPSLEELAAQDLPGGEGLGKLVVAYHYRHILSEGYRRGRNDLTDQQVLGLYPVVPVEITQEAHILSVGWLAGENWSIQATVPFVRQSTYHLSTKVAPFTLDSEGIGDVSVESHHAWTGREGARTYVGIGLGLPTGTIEAKGDTPRGPNSQLPYAMQLGSGTFDFKPSLGWSKQVGSNGVMGVDLTSAIRLGKNDRDYSLGDRAEIDVWYSHNVTDWLRLRPEVDVMWWGEIDGQDPEVTSASLRWATPSTTAAGGLTPA